MLASRLEIDLNQLASIIKLKVVTYIFVNTARFLLCEALYYMGLVKEDSGATCFWFLELFWLNESHIHSYMAKL